ncbi:BMQ_0737 family morphogenetic spore coat protein [Salibacterium lacus]|uniref:DUF3794 domain-containing protein n=1 Tax=Salibacterium lacus TaxID=1898109 RepID=A0ABW5T3C7_9BACI
MENKALQGGQELLCINAEKVYDWVILQNDVNQSVLAGDLGALPIDPCGPTVSNLTADCFIVDPDSGDPLPPNAEVPVTEIGERENRTFIIDGAQVTLQKVTFIKTLSVVVEFSGFDATTPFVERTEPIEIEIPESIFLCAPEGTRLVVRLTDVECSVNTNCTNGELGSVDVVLSLCQSVQAVADVTLELTADFCQPRDILIDQCPTPVVPPQCPVLFPGENGD